MMLTEINAGVLLIGALVVQAQLWWLAESSLTAHRRQRVLPWFVVYLSVRMGFRFAEIVLPHPVEWLNVIVTIVSWVCTIVLIWRLLQANRDSTHHLHDTLRKRDVQIIVRALEQYADCAEPHNRRKEDAAHAVGSH